MGTYDGQGDGDGSGWTGSEPVTRLYGGEGGVSGLRCWRAERAWRWAGYEPDRQRIGPVRRVLAGFRGLRVCRSLRRTADGGLLVYGCAWSGGEGGGALPVVQELAEVVDGAEQLELGVGGVAAAVAEVAAEPGEELGEERLYLGGAAFVQALAGRGGEPGRYVSSQMRHRLLLFPKLPPVADTA